MLAGLPVLVQHYPLRVGGGSLFGGGRRSVGPAFGRREDNLRAVELEQLPPFNRCVLRHHADQSVPLQPGHHRQRNAGVSAGGLQDGGARPQQPVGLGLLDHPHSRAVLDRPGRIAVLELGPQPHVRSVSPVIPAWRQSLQANQRRVAQGLQQRVVSCHVLRSPTGHGGEDGDRVTVSDRGGQAAGEPPGLVGGGDVHEAVEITWGRRVHQALGNARIVGLQVADDGTQGIAAGRDTLLAAGVGPQDGRNGYGDVHAGLSRNGSVLLDDIAWFLGDSAMDGAVAA